MYWMVRVKMVFLFVVPEAQAGGAVPRALQFDAVLSAGRQFDDHPVGIVNLVEQRRESLLLIVAGIGSGQVALIVVDAHQNRPVDLKSRAHSSL